MAKSRHSTKPLPTFKSESEERRFWETHHTTEYVDWSEARPARFPNLKPSRGSAPLTRTARHGTLIS